MLSLHNLSPSFSFHYSSVYSQARPLFAGFYGMINIGDEDASKKIKLYGIIMCVAGLVDLIIVFAVSHYDITGRTLLLICLPVIIGALYLGGAFLNVSQIRAKKGEDND